MRRKTKYTGVYERLSTVNRFQGKADVAYDFCYKSGGKLIWKLAGWKSDGMTAAEAADMRRDALRESKNKAAASMTFGEAWALYLRDWLQANGKACTASDTGLYANHLRRRLGSRPLAEIAPQDINAILRDMDGFAAQTKKHALGLVRRVYRKMMAWRLYHGEIPTANMMPGRVSNERMRFLTRKEAGMLLTELDCRAPDPTEFHALPCATLPRLALPYPSPNLDLWVPCHAKSCRAKTHRTLPCLVPSHAMPDHAQPHLATLGSSPHLAKPHLAKPH